VTLYIAGSWSKIRLAIKSIPYCCTQNEDDDHEHHVVLEVVDAVVADQGIIATKTTTIVLEVITIVLKITTKITIAQRVFGFWAHSKKPMHPRK